MPEGVQSAIDNPQSAMVARPPRDMVEGALTFPLMALVTLALVNLALAGFASTTANHAAGYGARAGSVAQVDPAARALEVHSRPWPAALAPTTYG